MTTKPIQRLGILGVGHLATFVVEGLNTVERNFEIMLSPRNHDTSRELATRFDVTVAADNQSLVDNCDVLLVSLRPEMAGEALQALQFSRDKIVVSVMAGVSLEVLAGMVAPALPVRSMPVSSAAVGQSPTVIFPANEKVLHLFDLIGSVFPAANEDAFDRMSIIGAYHAWLFALFAASVDWFAEGEIKEESAREFVLQCFTGAANVALDSPDSDLQEVLGRLATPGGMTEEGLRVLEERGAFDAWRAALQSSYDKFKKPSEKKT